MNCYCYETENEFIFCVEDAPGEILVNLESDTYWSKTDDGKFIKTYPTNLGWDDAWYLSPIYKEAVMSNFARLGQEWLTGRFDWREVLSFLAHTFTQNEIEWYIIGSTSEAALGVDVNPHDVDIAVHTRDFYKAKDLFTEYVIEPFGDNKGNWLVRYFGKLCIGGASVEVAADDKMNAENREIAYEKTIWNGCEVYVEPLRIRYEVEISRGREDRIKAIKDFYDKK